MIPLLFVLALQGQRPELTVTLDRQSVSVGEEVTLTVRATSESQAPLMVSVPPLDGFQVIARTERSEVAFGDTASRVSTLELRLRALEEGTQRLGPFSAEQEGETVTAPAVTIMVSRGQSGARSLSPRVLALLQRAPPPSRPGDPALTLVVSADRAWVGEQVDVVTAAWFPRDLRARLRRPPTLTPPSLSGVWSYPQPTPPGIAASRQVGGTWYDLFVSHQIVFPLVPGTVEIARASLQYSVPVALQFFSQEERFTLESNGARIVVQDLPAAGRPASFSGAVGRNLAFRRTVDAAATAGQAIPVEVTLEGQGNVALWPAPDLAWPGGLRHYQDRTDDRISSAGGLLGGTKTFRFLALPDSAGPLRLPALAYSYFDLETETYRTLADDGVLVQVAPAPESASSRPAPPPLLTSPRPPLAHRVWQVLPSVVWGALAAAPPVALLAMLAVGARRRRRRRRVTDGASDLPGADRRLLAALRAVVPDVDTRTGPSLGAALRAAGVERSLAQRIVQVREDFLRARYGRSADGATERALARTMDELTAALGGHGRHRERRGRRVLVVLLAAALSAPLPAVAQVSAEQLYADGAYRAAADAFARRAEREPDVAAHWYGLGAAEYRLGSDARARRAWLVAARLAPRHPSTQRALDLVPALDAASRRATWLAPATPAELALAALIFWLAGWLLLARYRRLGTRVALLLAGGLAIGAAAGALQLRYARPLALVLDPVPLRVSPHERAPEVTPLEAGASVRPRRVVGAWWFVDAGGGRSGWVPVRTVGVVSD